MLGSSYPTIARRNAGSMLIAASFFFLNKGGPNLGLPPIAIHRSGYPIRITVIDTVALRTHIRML